MTGAKGTFVPGRGWFIFGGNTGYTQTQQLQTIDGSWTTGIPAFQPDSNYCIVQVIKHIVSHNYRKPHFFVLCLWKMTTLSC